MKYVVSITDAARRDLQGIFDWIAEHDSLAHAKHVLDRISETVESVALFPARGTRPHELPYDLGSEYRQVFFKPYRIIYRIRGREVVVHLIADGRRSLQTVLLNRLTEI